MEEPVSIINAAPNLFSNVFNDAHVDSCNLLLLSVSHSDYPLALAVPRKVISIYSNIERLSMRTQVNS